ncbi:MAG TPA: hypothetical protein VHT91_21155 [Kofleriaceae bacterium]|jgi:hypothetical protein|nr:hypothetical protein [Kofleriaceae bacterium]
MIATSPDGQWAAVKRGREVMLFAGGAGPAAAGPTTVRIDLPTDDADLVMVGSPSVLAVVTRAPAIGGEPGHHVALYQPPSADVAVRHELDAAMRIAGLTGSRLVLVSLDRKAVTIVRIAGRALATQALDPGSPVEFAVGLERNQVLFSLLRKLETWDAVSCRPLLRKQLPLPPPPRTVGPAHGFLWATRPGGDEILVVRMSDGRPFRHALGVPIDDVIYHPASPLLILVTARGLVRLHCYAHSMTLIEAPWRPGMMLGQLVVGEDISLLGIAGDDDEPWRVPIGGSGAPVIALDAPEAAGEPVVTAADKLRAMRERSVQEALGRGDPAERPERPEPVDRPDSADRPERGARLERPRGLRLSLADRTDPVIRPDRADPAALFGRRDRADPSDLVGHRDRPDPGDPLGRPDRPDRSDPLSSGDRPDRSDPLGRPDRPDRENPLGDPLGRGDRPDRGNPFSGSERGERPERPERPERGDRMGPMGPDPSDRADTARGLSPALAAMASRRAEPRSRAEPRGRTWRDRLAALGAELVRGAEAELPAAASAELGELGDLADLGELGELAHRLALPAAARRALVALYGLYLVGEPAVSLARLAHALGDWTEPLGQGELGALAMLRRRGGKVALRGSVTDLLDGVGPRAIRVIGTAAGVPHPGAARLARDGRSDAAIELALARQLGRIAVIEGSAALALLEARLHGATAVALVPPLTRPLPWPRDTGLVVVAEPAAPAWVAALPALTAA